MRLHRERRILAKVAAVLGLFQGLAWASMSLAAIILHNWSPSLEQPTTYGKMLEYQIYLIFLKGNSDQPAQFAIRPTDFTIFMWIYFLISILWFALSADLFVAIHRGKRRQTNMMIIWGTLALIVSLVDLIFTCLLGRDYSVCDEDLTDETGLSPYYCFTAVGIVMTLAARGFALWLVNVTFAFLAIYVAANVIKEDTGFGSLHSFRSIPRATLAKSDTTGSLPRIENTDYVFSQPFRLPSLKMSQPKYSAEEPELPSFSTRGEKFTY
ncbi:hypothetical protein NQ318_016759 [Aromia moschata]|uniref:Uncharacterized protein n=1 Tax=Aromia moschata TaxID=1265417 RepID=A0AAV8Y676_9CUCU|nr:hypothetical protein NQ318_016759 [Aromia moschata]